MAETCAESKEEEKPKSRLAVAELEAALSASMFFTRPSSSGNKDISGSEVIVNSENLSVMPPTRSPTKSTDRKRHVRRFSREAMSPRSLFDVDSVSSSGHSVPLTLIANIGDVKFISYDSARSVSSRRSRKSRRSRCVSDRSRKRGNSLERDVSLAILQTAAGGAESAHFLVAYEQKSPIKSAEDILSDLFVSQDTSLETFSHDETVEFPNAFLDTSLETFSHDETDEFPNAFLVDATTEPTSEVVFTELSPSAPEDKDTMTSPNFARNDLDWTMETTGPSTTTISETGTDDSLFSFSDVVQSSKRVNELLYPEDVLDRIQSGWLPNDSPKAIPPTSTNKAEELTLETNSVLTDKAVVASPERNAQESPSVNRYSTLAGPGNKTVSPNRAGSTSDGASEVQHAFSFVSSSTAEMNVLSMALKSSSIERLDTSKEKVLSSSTPGEEVLSVEREQIFLDKLVDIVAKAQKERPANVHMSHYFESEDGKESNCAEEHETSRAQSGAADANISSVPRVESNESAPDPALDAFSHTRGFGDSNDGDGEGEWMAFDTSPFTNLDNMTATSGSTNVASQGDKPPPDSPTSITVFSSSSRGYKATSDHVSL